MEIKITYDHGDYKFYVNEQLAYMATKEEFALQLKWSIYAANSNTPKITLKKKSSMLTVAYEIAYADKTSLKLTVANAVKHHLQCKAGSDTYDIYGHKIETCSVYKNDIQVAWWNLKYSDDPKIIANSDCDKELLICIYILTQRIIQVRNDGQGIIANLATNAFEARPFDANWHPQHEPPPLR